MANEKKLNEKTQKEGREECTEKWRKYFAEHPEEAFRELQRRMGAMSRRIGELEDQVRRHAHMGQTGELVFRRDMHGTGMKSEGQISLGPDPLPPV